MKKSIFAVLVCLALILNYGVVMAAQTPTIKEDKAAKIIIDGTVLKITNVPVIKNKKLMLSTELFTACGISAKDQVWDKSKTKLTLTSGKTKIVLQINSSTATLNGVKKTLAVQPFMYKGKAYFQADFIASCFNKQFQVDTETNTYFLKTQTDFLKNKALFDNIIKSMNSISKVKITENVKFALTGNGVKLNLEVPAKTLTDRENGLATSDVTYRQATNGENTETNIQMVLANNSQYTSVDDEDWIQEELTDDQYTAQFDFSGMFDYDNIACSALNITNGKNKDEIILKGNAIVGATVSQFLEGQELYDTTLSAKSVEITLNKNTNIVSQIVFKVSGTTVIEDVKYNISLSYQINYLDVNGTFEIIIPEELQ